MEENQLFSEMPVRPKNWLVESILVTIFCCLPFGIAGIVNAASVDSKYRAGDYSGAAESSKQAAKWTKIGFWVGLIGGLLYLIAVFGLGLNGLHR
jgi:hypothetical protein